MGRDKKTGGYSLIIRRGKNSDIVKVGNKIYSANNAATWLDQVTENQRIKSGLSMECIKLMKRGGGVHQEQLACQGRYR